MCAMLWKQRRSAENRQTRRSARGGGKGEGEEGGTHATENTPRQFRRSNRERWTGRMSVWLSRYM